MILIWYQHTNEVSQLFSTNLKFNKKNLITSYLFIKKNIIMYDTNRVSIYRHSVIED